MKRIIDIPKEVVTAIQNGQDYRYDIHTAIAQGKPYKERPQGKWQETDELWETDCCGGMGYDYGYYFKCSACGKKVIDKTNFCPECGTDMRELSDE